MHTRKEPDEFLKYIFGIFGDSVCIAWSGGKASTIVVNIARRIKPNVNVMFVDTGVEFPETVAFVNRMAKAWKLNLHIVRPIPGVTFWTITERYELPSMRSSRLKHHVPKCCYYLKTYPADCWMWDHKIQVNITGLQSCESSNRAMLAGRYDNSFETKDGIPFSGQLYYARCRKRWHAHPIMHWSERRVFEYVHQRRLPMNPIYHKWGGVYKRNGCLTCTAYLSWEQNMSVSHPKLYAKLKPIWDKQQLALRYRPVRKIPQVR